MTTVEAILQSKGQMVWTVRPDDSVSTALAIMADKNIGALPVVGPSGLVGIFSERDYARRGVLWGRASQDTLVRDIMTTSLHSVRPEHSLDRCVNLMTNKRVRHLPVVDADGALVGVVSIGDVLKAMCHGQQEHLTEMVLSQPTVLD